MIIKTGKPTEAQVRPVFQRPRTVSLPVFNLLSGDAYNGHNVVYNIRPSKGVLWSLDYVQVMPKFSYGGGVSGYISIDLTDGTNTVHLKYSTALTAYNTLSWGSFGNGPLILTNSLYIIVTINTNYADPGSGLVDIAAATEQV